MKPRTRTFRGAKKFGNAISVAGTNARKTDGLFKAANHLVAKRMTLGAAAMSDPLNADHVELTKIIQDKTKAFAEVGMIWLQRSGEIAAQMAGFAANEMATIAEAMASCRTPADVIERQSNFAMVWFARALSQSIALGSLAMQAQGAATAPVHRTATANAGRLNR